MIHPPPLSDLARSENNLIFTYASNQAAKIETSFRNKNKKHQNKQKTKSSKTLVVDKPHLRLNEARL